MFRKNITIMSLLVVLLAVWIPGSSSAGPPGDDALRRHPGFAKFIERYPQDWEQRIQPNTRPIVTWQRIVGSHALILGWADEEPNPQYTTPRVGISVANWDHTDLFALGIPKVYNGKPVEIIDGGFPQ